jgi:Zn-dependent peptidase ImmA (M78 family)
MNRKRVRLIIAELLRANEITAPPVNVLKMAKLQGVEVRKRDFEEDLSGFAFQKDGERIIGVNASENPLRQRFTIAHELGHLYLDPRDDLNVDKNFAMKYRNGVSSEGTDLKEMEANYFAAELLMPEKFLRQDIDDHKKNYGGIDFEDDELVRVLADKYEVSRHAMSVRLASLHYI